MPAGTGNTGSAPGATASPQAAAHERTQQIQRLAHISLLAACALVLSYLETMIPLPVGVPGIKLGLGNIAVIVALFDLDVKSAAGVALVKVLASGFLFGSPAMLIYSAGGTVCAFTGMVALSLVPGMGLMPISMVAAVLHNVGQLAVAALALGSPSVFINLPVLAVAACVTGGITGAVATSALDSIMNEGADERPLVDASALAIEPGTLTVFAGANGSGKTTCALELAGLVDMADAEGRNRAAELLPASLPATVGVAFQDPDDQIVEPRVADDVAFGPENRGIELERMKQIVADALDESGIPELAAREVATLSGGQKQRVSLAGLLALSPGLIIFDETTAMLDEDARTAFLRAARRLCERGISVILISHIARELAAADRLVLFRDGAIVTQGTPRDLLGQHELLASCGLEA